AAIARAEAKKDDDLRKQARDLEEKIQAARKKGDEATAKALQAELRALQPSAMMLPGKKGAAYRRGDNKALARASDLPQPANPGHFLREFGQSDREQIESNHTDASVPQALALLNGFVDKTLLPARTSAVRQAAAAASTPEEKVRSVFRSLLSRDPAAKEKETWTADVRSRGDAAVGDLIWTLVNTREFMFIR
ncbi:MAG TPA: DUF1553 domain-containing protein, partial [Planctomycetota bacterium]|nr:DUF1553 domain-containing protein [Planctomycetota bacterium]